MALLRKFFCFELLTTGLIVGWLGIVESFTSVVSGFIMVENIDVYINPKYFPDTDPELVRRMVINMLGANIALNMIDLLASGMLVAGTVKRNRLYLLPWLINTGFSLLLGLLASTLLMFLVFSADKMSITTSVFILMVLLATMGFSVYTWLAVHSLYHLLRSQESEYQRLIDGNQSGQPTYTRA